MDLLCRLRWLDFWTDLLIWLSSCVFQYLEYCDNVLVLEDGEVQEAGDHKALMNANGRYAQLISNYQMEQSEVKKKKSYSTNLACTVALLFLTCFTIVV